MHLWEFKIAGLLLQKIIWLTDPSRSMFIELMLGWYVITSSHLTPSMLSGVLPTCLHICLCSDWESLWQVWCRRKWSNWSALFYVAWILVLSLWLLLQELPNLPPCICTWYSFWYQSLLWDVDKKEKEKDILVILPPSPIK